MRAHVEELAAGMGAVIETWEGTPKTTARLQRKGILRVPPEVIAEIQRTGEAVKTSEADLIYAPLILIKELRTRREYFEALHEVGHLALDHSGRLPDAPITGRDLYEEAEAWVWALDHARLPPSPKVHGAIDGSLTSYVLDAGAVTFLADDYAAEIVPADLRDAYRALIARLEAAGEATDGRLFDDA